MSDPYDELIEGEICLRLAPGARHEEICRRLHARVSVALEEVSTARLLAPRSPIHISRDAKIRPDLALVTAANNKLWLAAEIVSSDDHHPDTVLKKALYEDMNLPRLWMIDLRYDNVEVYHGSPHGLVLKDILAVQNVLREPLLPVFEYVIAELFQQR
jgi:Uma2 family endonuclease